MTKVLSFIDKHLTTGSKVVWLYVIESIGSSPGRRSFQMAINDDGDFVGTIGGGIMEVKLIALAKDMLKSKRAQPQLKKQYHHKEKSNQRSGMICSGEQSVVLMPLAQADLPNIQELIHLKNDPDSFTIVFSNLGISINRNATQTHDVQSETNFSVTVMLTAGPVIHIFGAGHVGMAAASQFSILEKDVILYDNRADLVLPFDMKQCYCLIDYDQIKSQIQLMPEDIVIIVSHSYRDDKVILKQLYNDSLSFIGIMGSDAKLAYLWKELDDEGIDKNELVHIRAPIGLAIYSQSAAEIAVSIAAEVIHELNKKLPTGRKQYVE